MKDNVKWILGVLLLIAGLGAVFTSPVSGIIYLILGLFLIPPVLGAVERKLNFRLPTAGKWAFSIGGLVIATVLGQRLSTEPDSAAIEATDAKLQADLLGVYHGIQPSYFLKNQFGDDMVINGNRVPVPSIDLKFVLKENGIVSLQQTNLEDNRRVYYDGEFRVIKDQTDSIRIECSLSDGQSSSPSYSLTINKTVKTATCVGHNEPEVNLKKIQ